MWVWLVVGVVVGARGRVTMRTKHMVLTGNGLTTTHYHTFKVLRVSVGRALRCVLHTRPTDQRVWSVRVRVGAWVRGCGHAPVGCSTTEDLTGLMTTNHAYSLTIILISSIGYAGSYVIVTLTCISRATAPHHAMPYHTIPQTQPIHAHTSTVTYHLPPTTYHHAHNDLGR